MIFLLFLLIVAPLPAYSFTAYLRPSNSDTPYVPYDQYICEAGALVDLKVTVDLDGLFTDDNCAWSCPTIYFYLRSPWNVLGSRIPVGERYFGTADVVYEDGSTASWSCSSKVTSETNRVTEIVFRELTLPDHMCYEVTFDARGNLVDTSCTDTFGIHMYSQDTRADQANGYTCGNEDFTGLSIIDPEFKPKAQQETFRAADETDDASSGSLSPGAIVGIVLGLLVFMCACFATGSVCTLLYTKRQRASRAILDDARSTTRAPTRGRVSRSVSGHVRH